MANDKTKTENLSVESRLRSLYELQTVLSEIDRIKPYAANFLWK